MQRDTKDECNNVATHWSNIVAKKTRKNPNKVTSIVRGIDRDIRKENGSLINSRGIHAVHTSRAEKRKSKRIHQQSAIEESKDQ